MKFYVAEIDSTGNDFHTFNGAYISTVALEEYNNPDGFNFAAAEIDDLVGLFYAFNDIRAKNAAMNKIMYSQINLRAIRLMMEAKKLRDGNSILRDLELIKDKLIFLGLGYISEKTYLVGHLSQYRMLLREYLDQIHTATITLQIYNFIVREIFRNRIPEWFETVDFAQYYADHYCITGAEGNNEAEGTEEAVDPVKDNIQYFIDTTLADDDSENM